MTELRMHLFGAFSVLRDGQPLHGFRSEKMRALLAYLVVESAQPQRRSQLAELLWHGYQPETAATSLRTALLNLRQCFAPLQCIQADRQMVQFVMPPAYEPPAYEQ